MYSGLFESERGDQKEAKNNDQRLQQGLGFMEWQREADNLGHWIKGEQCESL